MRGQGKSVRRGAHGIASRSTVYFLAVFLPLLALVALGVVASYFQQVKSESALIERNEQLLIDFQKALITNQLNIVLEDMAYLTALAELSNLLGGDFGKKEIVAAAEQYAPFLRRKMTYDRIRIIDLSGRERFALAYEGGRTRNIPESELQSAAGLPYFAAASNLRPGQLLVTRLDISYGHVPPIHGPKPVIRFATPVSDSRGQARAILVLDYLAETLVGHVREAAHVAFGRTMLLSASGYWLYSPNAEDQWGFMIDGPAGRRESMRFGARFPEVWKAISTAESGVVHSEDALFIFNRVYPMMDPGTEAPATEWDIVFTPTDAFYWLIVSHVPRALILERSRGFLERLVTYGALVSLLLLAVAVLLSRTRRHRLLAETQLGEEAAIFVNNPAPVLRVRRDGRILKLNPAARLILGDALPDGAEVGVGIDVLSGFRFEDIEDLGPSESYQFEQRISRDHFLFTVRRSAVEDAFLLYGSDITSRKASEEEIRRLSTAVEQSATSILITDLEGRISFANKACEKVSGYRVAELVGRHTRVFRSGHHDARFYQDLWETITAGDMWHGEFLNLRKDGTTYWEEATISPVRDEDQRITGYLAVKEDVTLRKEAEEQLRRAKDEAEAASSLKSDFLANMSHEIRTPMNAILGFTDFLLDDERDPGRLRNLEIIRSSGRHLLALINDILDFSKIEADKVELEIRPFAFRGMMDHLRGLISESVREKGLNLSVDIDESVPPVVLGDEHRIAQVLLNILDNAVKFTEEGGITLSCSYSGEIATLQVADTGIGIPKEKLETIFSAFEQASSSTERTHGGTGLGLAISRRLADMMKGSLRARSLEGQGSEFSLELPLPPADIDDPAWAGAMDLDEQEVGSLEEIPTGDESMVQRWFEANGNDPDLERVIIRGIRDLPVKVTSLRQALDDNDGERLRGIAHDLKGYTGNLQMTEAYHSADLLYRATLEDPQDSTEIRSRLDDLGAIVRRLPPRYLYDHGDPGPGESEHRRFRILTAEDNDANQELIGVLLDRIGLATDFARDGRETMRLLEQGPYDLLLLDMQMPVMDGIETIKAIRAKTEYDGLHVIAITAHAMEGDQERYLGLGCNDYLSKPIDRGAFARKVSALRKKALDMTAE